MPVAEQPAIIVQMMNGAGGCWGVDDVVGRRSVPQRRCDGACEASDADGDQPVGGLSTESGSGGGVDRTADLGIVSGVRRDDEERE
jgi:hypothetical protein